MCLLYLVHGFKANLRNRQLRSLALFLLEKLKRLYEPEVTVAQGALQTFESVARHLSLTKAANELHVTPAAVSHQIRALEDWISVSRFCAGSRVLSY